MKKHFTTEHTELTENKKEANELTDKLLQLLWLGFEAGSAFL
jgi:hypothetical protein